MGVDCSTLTREPDDVGMRTKCNRLLVEAALHRYLAGIPWRESFEQFGDFRFIHTRHHR